MARGVAVCPSLRYIFPVGVFPDAGSCSLYRQTSCLRLLPPSFWKCQTDALIPTASPKQSDHVTSTSLLSRSGDEHIQKVLQASGRQGAEQQMSPGQASPSRCFLNLCSKTIGQGGLREACMHQVFVAPSTVGCCLGLFRVWLEQVPLDSLDHLYIYNLGHIMEIVREPLGALYTLPGVLEVPFEWLR